MKYGLGSSGGRYWFYGHTSDESALLFTNVNSKAKQFDTQAEAEKSLEDSPTIQRLGFAAYALVLAD